MKIFIFLPAIIGTTVIVFIVLAEKYFSSDSNIRKKDGEVIIKTGNLYKIKYENHNYIVFDGCYKGCIIHDPDCECKGEK